MFIVQRVQILWTKETRGAPRANERAILPRVFSVAHSGDDFGFYFHKMIEQDDFKVNLVEQRQAARISVGESCLVLGKSCLALKEGPDDEVTLGLRWSSADGQPKRYPRLEVIRLAQGQWAQLIMNGRHASYSGQFYSEDVYNVAYGESIAADVFTAREPDHRFSLVANLF
jgi:hypothetical protein